MNCGRRQWAAVWVGVVCLGLLPVGPLTAQEPKLRDTLKGHTAAVFSVAFSPDGKTLASGSEDTTIKLWDVATAKEQATLQGHMGWVYVRGFQSGRQDAGLGEPGPDDQAVGRDDGQGTSHPQGTHGLCVLRGFQSGRQDAGLGERRPDDQAVGRGDGQGTGHPQGTHRRYNLRGVQSGRQDPGLGEPGPDGSSYGTWRRARNKPPSRDTRAWCCAWRSVRTARRWPRGAWTRRSSCGM